MREAELVRKMNSLKAKYNDLFEDRVRQFDLGVKAVSEEWRNKETELYTKIEAIKDELANINPDKWAFGAKKNKTRIQGARTYNRGGDNGFVICGECMRLFEHDPYNQKTRHIADFSRCKDHSNSVAVGMVEVNTEFVNMSDFNSPALSSYGKKIGLERIHQ